MKTTTLSTRQQSVYIIQLLSTFFYYTSLHKNKQKQRPSLMNPPKPQRPSPPTTPTSERDRLGSLLFSFSDSPIAPTRSLDSFSLSRIPETPFNSVDQEEQDEKTQDLALEALAFNGYKTCEYCREAILQGLDPVCSICGSCYFCNARQRVNDPFYPVPALENILVCKACFGELFWKRVKVVRNKQAAKKKSLPIKK